MALTKEESSKTVVILNPRPPSKPAFRFRVPRLAKYLHIRVLWVVPVEWVHFQDFGKCTGDLLMILFDVCLFIVIRGGPSSAQYKSQRHHVHSCRVSSNEIVNLTLHSENSLTCI